MEFIISGGNANAKISVVNEREKTEFIMLT